MTITFEVPDQKVANALDAASSKEWAEVITYPEAGSAMLRFLKGMGEPIVIDEHGDEEKAIKRHTVTATDIRKGLEVLAVKFPHTLRDIMQDDGDMYTGDLLLQCAIFGDETYC